jgi:hypothetical protein
MDEVEYEDIELLGDEFHHALVGAVYGEDGTPVPCYLSGLVVEQLTSEGLTEEQAVEYVNEVTEGARILWIHPLELQPEFSPDNRPHLRLVH